MARRTHVVLAVAPREEEEEEKEEEEEDRAGDGEAKFGRSCK